MNVVDMSIETRIGTCKDYTESDLSEALNRSIEVFDASSTCPIRDSEQFLAETGETLGTTDRTTP